MIKKLSDRFDQLFAELNKIESSKTQKAGLYGKYESVDEEMLAEWTVKAKALISKTCGESSEHIKSFACAEKTQSFDTNYQIFKRLRPIFLAAKDDFQGGFLTSTKNLIQAEIFDSELEQAKELLSSGYKGPAAVVAGVVLETTLKDLCDRESIPHGKMDTMNSALTKAGVYNKLQQKRITALADIRNSAAHGDWTSFTDQDVSEMIRDVSRFLADHLA